MVEELFVDSESAPSRGTCRTYQGICLLTDKKLYLQKFCLHSSLRGQKDVSYTCIYVLAFLGQIHTVPLKNVQIASLLESMSIRFSLKMLTPS